MNRRVFGVLLVAAVVVAAALVPYELALAGLEPGDVPLEALVVSVLLSGALVSIAGLVGLFLGRPLGLGAPVLEAQLAGQRPSFRPIGTAAVWGVATGVLILVLAVLVFNPVIAGDVLDPTTVPQPSPAAGALAAVGAGLTEELLFRLGLVTLLVWLGVRLGARTDDRRPATWFVWGGLSSPSRWRSARRTCQPRRPCSGSRRRSSPGRWC